MKSPAKRFVVAVAVSLSVHSALLVLFRKLPKETWTRTNRSPAASEIPVQFFNADSKPSDAQRPLLPAMDQEIDLSRFLHVEPDSQTRSGESGNAWHLTEKGGKRQSGSSLVPQGTGLLDSASSGTPGVGAAGGVDVAARGSDTMESQPFRFASFFSRLRWALEPAWQWRVGRLKNPGVLQKNTYLTAIEVQLSPDGRVLGRHLKSSSGWAQADLAALQAVSQMEQLQQLPPDLYREIEGRLDLRFHLKVKPEGFSWSKIEDPRFKDL